MKILTIISALIILITSGSATIAGSYGDIQIGFPAPTHQELAKFYFGHMDFNEDKTLDRSEFENSKFSTRIESFDAMKPNENGVLSFDGFIKYYVEKIRLGASYYTCDFRHG